MLNAIYVSGSGCNTSNMANLAIINHIWPQLDILDQYKPFLATFLFTWHFDLYTINPNKI